MEGEGEEGERERKREGEGGEGEGEGEGEGGVSLSASSSFVRGLKCSDKALRSLKKYAVESRSIFLRHVIPMLERWVTHAVRAHPLSVVCAIHFHISLLLNVLKDEDLDENLVTLHVTAHILMASHFPFRTDPITGRPFGGEGNLK